jgi:hypothetical protein
LVLSQRAEILLREATAELPDSGRFFGHPVAKMQEFFDLATLVTVFERLLGVMFGFAERMFRIANGFADYFDCFHHTDFFLSSMWLA